MKRIVTFLACFWACLIWKMRQVDAFSCGAWYHRAPTSCSFIRPPRGRCSPTSIASTMTKTYLLSRNNDNDQEEEWSDFAELPKNDNMNDEDDDEDATPKLGIDLQLDPLTEQEAEDLKAEATELINEKIAEGVDDIRKLRADLQQELLESQKLSQLQSELRTQQESERLMSRIDRLTDEFLSQTELTRKSTKLAAQADQQSSGRGLEYGSWGVLEGGSVVRMTAAGQDGAALLGSVDAAKKKISVTSSTSSTTDIDESVESAPTENRVLIVADESQDTLAKALLPAFTYLLQKAIPDVVVQTVKPTATMPLGGDNAQCAILFATSFNDKSGVNNALDRLLRRTMQASTGTVSSPPSQLVCISTLGTERTDKLPYSMQNMIGGGKLEKRRQMEESIITTVQQRAQTPLDYTICKFGEKLQQTSGKNTDSSFQLKPGDVLDGSTDVDTAAHVLLQAVAYQPAARNATFCVSGSLNDYTDDELWNDLFLQLDGPELLRMDDGQLLGDSSKYQQLVEYMNEWGIMLQSGQKLTTPIRVEPSTLPANPQYEGVKQRGGVRLLFLPTNTGKAYLSRDEERVREKELRGGGGRTTTTATKRTSNKREGGVEVLVEVTTNDTLRVRARRCNMADHTIVKELSEETLLKRLQDSLEVWKKQL